jgi:hypothetical protein
MLRIGEGLVHRAGAAPRDRSGESGAARRPWIGGEGATSRLGAIGGPLDGNAPLIIPER